MLKKLCGQWYVYANKLLYPKGVGPGCAHMAKENCRGEWEIIWNGRVQKTLPWNTNPEYLAACMQQMDLELYSWVRFR